MDLTDTISRCPVCASKDLHFVLKAADHTVCKESFEIWECAFCSLRFTQNAPDETLIQKYYLSENYISHTNTNKGLVNRLYHWVRKRTLAGKYRLIHSCTAVKKGRHLDIGAGTGAFVQYMNAKGWESTGIEPDENARKTAMEAHQAELLSAESLFQLQENSFDAITLWHVLEHVHDLHEYMVQIKKILKPSGRIFIAVPNYTSYDAAFYKDHWAAYDVPRHLYHFSPNSMRFLLTSAGLRLQEMKPMWYDAFYISLLSEKYKTGSTNLPKGFIKGTVSDLKALFDKERCSSLVYVAGK